VSCAVGQCIAVGSYYSSAGSHTLVETTAGSAWRLEPSPDGPQISSLGAVACDPTGDCLAVGSPVLAGSGDRWQVVSPSSTLDAVSCGAAGSCVAVGANARVALYATWTGRAWRTGPMQPPPQQAQSVTIAGVSCTSAASCVAVGSYSYGAGAAASGGYRDKVLAEHWNGSSWRLLPAANVGPADELSAVSCASADDCTAVGTSAQQHPVAELWNGTTWRVESVPAAGAVGYTELTGVSCVSAASCVAVGTYQGQPIALSSGGGNWRLQMLPEPPADNHSAQLNGVACTGKTACTAVGVSGSGLSYAERYNGTTWQLATTQNPA
jgi:hypothetical protein